LTSIANQICEVVNQYVIRELVDMNYNVEKYPKLKCQKITKIDNQKIADTISTLVGGGIITTDGNIEDYMRDLMGLPAREEDAEMEDAEQEPMDEMDDQDQADMESELEDLANSDSPDAETEFNEMMEVILDFSEGATFRAPMSDETKKKISEALMKNKGGKVTVDRIKKGLDQTKDNMAKTREQITALRSELAGVPK
jgi:Protein of unknown function (DUF935)